MQWRWVCFSTIDYSLFGCDKQVALFSCQWVFWIEKSPECRAPESYVSDAVAFYDCCREVRFFQFRHALYVCIGHV